MRRFAGPAVLVGAVFLTAIRCPALVNPRFTPINLVEQSNLIATVKLAAPDAKGRMTAQVVKCIKGKAPAEKVTIDLLAEWVKHIAADVAKQGDEPALLFVGSGEDKQEAAFLHVAGRWVRLESRGDAAFAMTAVDVEMRGTWAGGTDMLLRAVEYILSDPSADVPVAVGCSWAERKALGKIEGPVHAAQAIDLTGQGQICLFVAAENGDRIYRYDATGKQFTDATAGLKLRTKSRLAAWADFTGDGRADLASCDGKTLTLWAQAADGTFPAAGVPLGAELKGGCLGLTALDAGVPGRAGLLAGAADGPVLLAPQKDGSFKATALDAGGADRKTLGPPGACLVADLDGDGLADVLELFAESSLFYRGEGGGAFARGVRCEVAQGKGRAVAWLGDFDADGRMDIFMSGQDDCRLWQNRGGMKFAETFNVCGEPAYMAQSKAVCGQTCDINNDGRPDVLIGSRESIPMLFFNRGFRSLAKALELTEDNVIPEASGGVQAAVVEDFNGDGAPDLAVVLSSGEVRMFVRSADEASQCAAVRVSLPMGKGFAGPLTVTGWAGKRCLAAWNVTAGSPGVLIGRGGAGEIVLKWQFPGGKPAEQKMTVIDKPIRLVLGE